MPSAKTRERLNCFVASFLMVASHVELETLTVRLCAYLCGLIFIFLARVECVVCPSNKQ